MRNKFRSVLIIMFLICFIPCAFSAKYLTVADIKRLPYSTATARIQYGNDARQVGELRVPQTGTQPYPIVVLIHGGCWRDKYAKLDVMSPLATAFSKEGVATWNIDYRGVDNPAGRWPGTFQDISHAIDYLRTIAPQYHLDLNRIVIVGHSAGGHLALWAAARYKLPKNSELYAVNALPIRGVVNLAGPGNLASFIPLQESVCKEKVITELMGGNRQQQSVRYQQGSPIELLPLGIKQILITGEDDPYVPPYLAEEYTKAAKRAGDNVQFILVKNAAHIDLTSPNTNSWQLVKKSVFDLLKS